MPSVPPPCPLKSTGLKSGDISSDKCTIILPPPSQSLGLESQEMGLAAFCVCIFPSSPGAPRTWATWKVAHDPAEVSGLVSAWLHLHLGVGNSSATPTGSWPISPLHPPASGRSLFLQAGPGNTTDRRGQAWSHHLGL